MEIVQNLPPLVSKDSSTAINLHSNYTGELEKLVVSLNGICYDSAYPVLFMDEACKFKWYIVLNIFKRSLNNTNLVDICSCFSFSFIVHRVSKSEVTNRIYNFWSKLTNFLFVLWIVAQLFVDVKCLYRY